MLYYCSMELHYCKESPKKKKNVTQVQVQILCKFCASIFPCFTLFFQKLFRISHKKRSFSRFKPDFSRYFGYFPVPFGVGVVEAARSSRVTQTRKPSSLVQNAQIRGLFLIKNASFLWFLHNGLTSASERVIGALFFLRIFYEFIFESSTNRLRNTLENRCFVTLLR